MPLNLTVKQCLDTIAARDGEIRAWSHVDPRGGGAGPLAGVPFGVKDIFETAGLRTEYGSPIYTGRIGTKDSALVEMLCSLGAVLLGKTHTTAFAYYDPAPTRNPRNLGHTPGGSSSGSAAAVAAGMCAFAIGTQTQGSVIRPAAFCGICGFKPTHGVLPLEGCLPFAPTLDTAGLFTASAADMRELWQRMGFPAGSAAATRFAAIEAHSLRPALARWNLPIDFIETPRAYEDARAAVVVVNAYEGARTHQARWREHGSAVGAKLAELIERGLAIPETEYLESIARLGTALAEMEALFAKYPVLLSRAAPGPAPAGLASTGDPRMNAPWTGIGVPAITIPLPGPGLPLGLQLTAGRRQEALLLASACRVEELWQNDPHD